jgi:CRISP-associated protein Cas1
MMDSPSPDVPDLVPARMVNEFAYCQRLFFLEWVQARFADNTDTVEGRWHHRVVDQPGGRAPLPEEEGELRVARSLMLSSPELGLVAKADLVEAGEDGEAVPVDYKRGTPPDNELRSWEPERVQLCVVGLLLREAGYRCTHGYLYFAEVRIRVRVDFDDELVGRTLGLVGELRSVAASDLPPPPLVDSPKCPRCSLVGLCLPDETNALTARSARPPRRLLPSRDDAHPLYVNEQGAWIGKDKGRLTVKKDRVTIASLRLIDVSQLCIYGNVQVSTQVLRELMASEIPVCYFSYGGWFSGMAHGLPSKHVELRRRQVIVASQGGLAIARRLIASKILNSRTLLRRNSRARPERAITQLKDASGRALEADTVATLLGSRGPRRGPTSRASRRCCGPSCRCQGRGSRSPTATAGPRLTP